MLKFHDDPMLNESEIVILLIKIWWYVEKKEGSGRRERKNEIERKKRYRLCLFILVRGEVHCVHFGRGESLTELHRQVVVMVVVGMIVNGRGKLQHVFGSFFSSFCYLKPHANSNIFSFVD